MACCILHNKDDTKACFYCSTTEVAFGPTMKSSEQAKEFAAWLSVDPRSFSTSELIARYGQFRVEKDKKNE